MFTLLSIPGYLVVMFIVMVGTDFIFVKPNEFDKERKYIEENINSTREAYGINEAIGLKLCLLKNLFDCPAVCASRESRKDAAASKETRAYSVLFIL